MMNSVLFDIEYKLVRECCLQTSVVCAWMRVQKTATFNAGKPSNDIHHHLWLNLTSLLRFEFLSIPNKRHNFTLHCFSSFLSNHLFKKTSILSNLCYTFGNRPRLFCTTGDTGLVCAIWPYPDCYPRWERLYVISPESIILSGLNLSDDLER